MLRFNTEKDKKNLIIAAVGLVSIYLLFYLIKEGNNMNKRVFISFDYEDDAKYRNLLVAWSENEDINFKFDDRTPMEIQTDSVSKVKEVLTKKIKESDICLVIIGDNANKKHKDSLEIGFKNWINYEISKAKEFSLKLIGVKINLLNNLPEELHNAGAKIIYSFNREEIIKAIKNS